MAKLFQLFGITYLVGKIKFKLLFQGPLAKSVLFSARSLGKWSNLTHSFQMGWNHHQKKLWVGKQVLFATHIAPSPLFFGTHKLFRDGFWCFPILPCFKPFFLELQTIVRWFEKISIVPLFNFSPGLLLEHQLYYLGDCFPNVVGSLFNQ